MVFPAEGCDLVGRMVAWHTEVAVPFLSLSVVEWYRFHAKIFKEDCFEVCCTTLKKENRVLHWLISCHLDTYWSHFGKGNSN